MTRSRPALKGLRLAHLAALTAVFAACSQAMPASSGSARPTAAGQDETTEFSTPESIALAREDSIRRPYTAADIEFMSGMIHHHRQAVTISRWAPTHRASERVRTLASRIILGQDTEIGIMKKWLADRRQPVPPVTAAMPMNMPGMDHSQHAALMPGMLTDAQMKQLDAARGSEFDRLFLTFMIQHHYGAISMVDKLMMTPGAGQDEIIWKFSAEIQAGQTTEIERMQQILETIPGGR